MKISLNKIENVNHNKQNVSSMPFFSPIEKENLTMKVKSFL